MGVDSRIPPNHDPELELVRWVHDVVKLQRQIAEKKKQAKEIENALISRYGNVMKEIFADILAIMELQDVSDPCKNKVNPSKNDRSAGEKVVNLKNRNDYPRAVDAPTKIKNLRRPQYARETLENAIESILKNAGRPMKIVELALTIYEPKNRDDVRRIILSLRNPLKFGCVSKKWENIHYGQYQYIPKNESI